MIETINDFVQNMGDLGPAISCLFIIIESMVPILPLCVFIVINFLCFGSFIGLLISWVFTIIGCMLAFFLVRSAFRKRFEKRLRKNEKVNKLMKRVDKWKFTSLVVIMAIPFTPASLVNVAAALSKMDTKKYFAALLVGKIFMVYFWGIVGLGLIESLTNREALIKIIVMVLIAYVISKIVSKKYNLE